MTLCVNLCIQHDERKAARRAGPFATVDVVTMNVQHATKTTYLDVTMVYVWMRLITIVTVTTTVGTCLMNQSTAVSDDAMYFNFSNFSGQFWGHEQAFSSHTGKY